MPHLHEFRRMISYFMNTTIYWTCFLFGCVLVAARTAQHRLAPYLYRCCIGHCYNTRTARKRAQVDPLRTRTAPPFTFRTEHCKHVHGTLYRCTRRASSHSEEVPRASSGLGCLYPRRSSRAVLSTRTHDGRLRFSHPIVSHIDALETTAFLARMTAPDLSLTPTALPPSTTISSTCDLSSTLPPSFSMPLTYV